MQKPIHNCTDQKQFLYPGRSVLGQYHYDENSTDEHTEFNQLMKLLATVSWRLGGKFYLILCYFQVNVFYRSLQSLLVGYLWGGQQALLTDIGLKIFRKICELVRCSMVWLIGRFNGEFHLIVSHKVNPKFH